MNHELRTPLNAIIGFSTMLKEGETYRLSDEQRDAYADYVLQSADLLLGHINTILEIAALDSGGVTLRKGNADISEIVSAAVERACGRRRRRRSPRKQNGRFSSRRMGGRRAARAGCRSSAAHCDQVFTEGRTNSRSRRAWERRASGDRRARSWRRI